MKLRELYKKVVEIGLAHDIRSKEQIESSIEKNRRYFEALSEEEKHFFDKEFLIHPYADTRILYGDRELELSSVFVGIDVDTSELLLVDKLRDRGEKIDLVISHHPSARAWAQFYEVMDLQVDRLAQLGINPVVAENLLKSRKGEVARKIMAANHFKTLSAAKKLNLPWLCVHTPADNCVTAYITDLVNNSKPKTLGDILEILYTIPEYREGARRGVPPVILLGSKDSRVGKTYVDMTGGTEGPRENFEYLAQSGIGTVIGMHFSEEHYKKAKESKLNLIIAGHIPSDTLGMNLLLDQVEETLGKLSVIEGAGFFRITDRR